MKQLKRKYIIGDDGDKEWLCEHGVGHSENLHTCEGCCDENGQSKPLELTEEQMKKVIQGANQDQRNIVAKAKRLKQSKENNFNRALDESINPKTSKEIINSPEMEEFDKKYKYSQQYGESLIEKEEIKQFISQNFTPNSQANSPIGVSEWREHGKKYSYDKYFHKDCISKSEIEINEAEDKATDDFHDDYISKSAVEKYLTPAMLLIDEKMGDTDPLDDTPLLEAFQKLDKLTTLLKK